MQVKAAGVEIAGVEVAGVRIESVELTGGDSASSINNHKSSSFFSTPF